VLLILDHYNEGRQSCANMTLGPAGLTALKSLREEGFSVVAFERRNEIGGLWAFSNNTSYTSVLKETVCNVSKFIVSEQSCIARISSKGQLTNLYRLRSLDLATSRYQKVGRHEQHPIGNEGC
jgi:heterodisulfide reductase subunit A-like polyferredoxin